MTDVVRVKARNEGAMSLDAIIDRRILIFFVEVERVLFLLERVVLPKATWKNVCADERRCGLGLNRMQGTSIPRRQLKCRDLDIWG